MEEENLEPNVENSSVEDTQTTQTPTDDSKDEFGIEGELFDRFKSPTDLAKSYSELNNYLSNSIRIPSEDASEDAWNDFNTKLQKVDGMVRLPAEDDADGWNNFYQRMGRPAAPEGYQYEKPEGFETNPESDAEFNKIAFEAGLTRDQAAKIYGHLTGNIQEANASIVEEQQKGMDELRREWGQAFDHEVSIAQNAAKMLDDKIGGVLDYFDAVADQGGDHMMVRLMNEFGKLAGETGAIQTEAASVMTPAEAKMRISEIRDNKDHPYNNTFDPAHEAANEKMRELYLFAYPK